MTFSRRSTKRTSPAQDAFVIKKSDTRMRTAAVEIEKHFDGKSVQALTVWKDLSHLEVRRRQSDD